MFRHIAAVAALSLSLAVLSGCGGTKQPPASAPSVDNAPAPASTTGTPTATKGMQHYAIVSAESKARYRAREKFINRELPSEAVGATSDIKGELVLDPNKLASITPSTISVDLRTLQSDSSKRDGTLRQRFLESDKYPMAEFTLKSISGATALQDGQAVPIKLAGTMKAHDKSKDLTWEGTAKLQGNKLNIKADTNFQMPDFGITVPDIAGMLKAEPGLKLEIELTAQAAQ